MIDSNESKEQFIELNNEFNDLIIDYEKLNDKYKKEKDNEINNLKEEYKKNINEKDKEINTLKEENEKINNEIIKLNTDYEKKINEKDKEINNLKEEYKNDTDEKEKEINNLKEEYKKNIKEKDNEINNLKEEYKKNIKEKDKEINNLKEEYKNNTDEKDKEINNLKAENEKMNKEKLESNNEYQELIENLIYKFYENEKKNLKIPENINEEEQKNSAEDKNESKKEKDKIEKENKINNLNYISVDVDDEKYEKKEFLTKDFKTKKQNGLVIGFFGNILQGKTYFLNELFDCDLPLNSTETINYYFLKDNVRIIDTPGLNNNNNLTNQNFKDNIIKLKKKDFLIQKFVLDNSIISIYIINSYNLENRKKIGKLRKILYENYKETSVMKSLYIIHNIFQIQSKEDYEQYVKNNFPNDDFYNNENICFCEKLNNEKAEDKFEILHFVYNPYYLTENIIKRIKEQINSHIQIELLDFNDIYNKFLQSLKQLFNQDINSSLNNSVSDYYNDSLKISDDNIYFNSK